MLTPEELICSVCGMTGERANYFILVGSLWLIARNIYFVHVLGITL